MDAAATGLLAALIAIGLVVISAMRESDPEAGMVKSLSELLALAGSMAIGVLALATLLTRWMSPGR